MTKDVAPKTTMYMIPRIPKQGRSPILDAKGRKTLEKKRAPSAFPLLLKAMAKARRFTHQLMTQSEPLGSAIPPPIPKRK